MRSNLQFPLAAAMLLAASGCGLPQHPPPTIEEFSADRMRVQPGRPVVLMARFSNGGGLLAPINESMASGKPITVTPFGTTKYTLHVIGIGGAVARDLTVVVDSTPFPDLKLPDVVVAGTETTASVPEEAGATYAWTLRGGRVLSGADTRTLRFVPNASGQLQAEVALTQGGFTHRNWAYATIHEQVQVTQEPQNRRASVGATVEFAVEATGNGTPGYQWFRDGAALPGATSARLRLEALRLEDTGSYRCRVTSSLGGTMTQADSAPALLEVVATPETPAVTLDPYLTAGRAGCVAATRDQGPGATYQWSLENGTITAGQGTPTLTFTPGAAGPLAASVAITLPGGTRSGRSTAEVVPAPQAPTLSAPASLHPLDGPWSASVAPQARMAYRWSLEGGTPLGPVDGPRLDFRTGAPGPHGLRIRVQNQAGDSAEATASIEVRAGAWLPGPGAPAPRFAAAASLLQDGSYFLIGGGYLAPGVSKFQGGAERFDPASATWAPFPAPALDRSEATATLLGDGRVLLAGGITATAPTATCELYDPARGTWTAAPAMAVPRHAHSATRLPDGSVLVIGNTRNPERFDPAAGRWIQAAAPAQPRDLGTATLLQDGSVLLAGGRPGGTLTSTERYLPGIDSWVPAGNLATSRWLHVAVRLADGRVLVAGGADPVSTDLASAELYDPAIGTWRGTGSMAVPRRDARALLLPDGRVLVIGGTSTQALASCEIFDPATETWSPGGTLAAARNAHHATLLPGGKVLVVGGYGAGTTLGAPETWK